MFCDMTHSTKDNSNRKKECFMLTLCWSRDFLIWAQSSSPSLSKTVASRGQGEPFQAKLPGKILTGLPPTNVLLTDDIRAALCAI